MIRPLAALVLAFAISSTAAACGCPVDQDLVVRAFSTDAADAELARVALRAAGFPGLMFVDHQHRDHPELASEEAWDALYDRVGQQRGCRSSLLYWHTDFEEARAEARQRGVPIVALRLLGRLTDEYSCANSRFFRAALYSDPDVSLWLRGHVVLLWESERETAPQLTIDFGGGRVYRGTIGGNSAHFVLDPEGRPLDVLPGMYGPQPFLERLRAAEACSAAILADPARREEILGTYHRDGLALEDAALTEIRVWGAQQTAGGDDVSVAQAITTGKSMVEAPVLDAIGRLDRDVPRPLAPRVRARIAGVHPEFGALSYESRALIARQLAGMRALGAGIPSDDAALAAVESAIADDTVIDEYALHRRIHQRFLDGAGDRAALDAWLYAEVFRTPAADPYLGLMPRAWDGLAHQDRPDGGVASAR